MRHRKYTSLNDEVCSCGTVKRIIDDAAELVDIILDRNCIGYRWHC